MKINILMSTYNGEQFFAVDDIKIFDERKIEDIFQMSIRFMEYNSEVYVSYEYLVEKYIEYLFLL